MPDNLDPDPMPINDTFLKACRGEKTNYIPVWMMRQAGRYLPEYQKVRGNISFLDLCKRPDLCVEVTLQPVDRLHTDAAILFSDILIPMEAMGASLDFHEGRGPVFRETIRNQAGLDRLIVPDPYETMGFVLETIRLLRRELQVPLIGFAGAPFTCATYLIEGGTSKTFWETKKMMFTQPDLFAALLNKITQCTLAYLKAQAEAGAQALQIFDSWAGVLAPCDFEEFALPCVQRIIEGLQGYGLPIIYFANNGATLLDLSVRSGADVLAIDWRLNIRDAIKRVGKRALQGNLDPFALLLPRERLRERIRRLLHAAEDAHGYIFNLGHGVHQYTPPDQVKCAIDAVHELSSEPK